MRASAMLVEGWFARVSNAGRDVVTLPPPDAPEWEAFEAHASLQTLRAARSAAMGICVLVVVCWPIEALTMTRAPAEQVVFDRWRVGTLAVFAAMYATLTWLPVARRNPAFASAPFSVAAVAQLTILLGRLGGLELPYFDMVAGAAIVPIIAPVAFTTRLTFLAALDVGTIGGFFAPHPEYLSHARLPESLITMAVLSLASLLIGHATYVGFCHRFFQSLTIERTARELETLNRELGLRVREKTADLRNLAEHLQRVQEDERGHIARELHDELGQRLSALRYDVANARQLHARAPESAGPVLAELDAMVAGALDCTRHIVSGLRPPLLDQLGLAAAAEWLAQRLEETTQVRCTVDLGDDERCSPDASVAAYRVLQESLTNVARHAGAKNVAIQLRVTEVELALEVRDDGCGFPPAGAAAKPNRNGLFGMRERALALGGALTTDNAPEGGARVRLRLPLKPHTGENSP